MLEEKLAPKEAKEYAEKVVESLTESQLRNQEYSLVFKFNGNMYSYNAEVNKAFVAPEVYVKSLSKSVKCVRELFDLDSNGYLLGRELIKTE